MEYDDTFFDKNIITALSFIERGVYITVLRNLRCVFFIIIIEYYTQ